MLEFYFNTICLPLLCRRTWVSSCCLNLVIHRRTDKLRGTFPYFCWRKVDLGVSCWHQMRMGLCGFIFPICFTWPWQTYSTSECPGDTWLFQDDLLSTITEDGPMFLLCGVMGTVSCCLGVPQQCSTCQEHSISWKVSGPGGGQCSVTHCLSLTKSTFNGKWLKFTVSASNPVMPSPTKITWLLVSPSHRQRKLDSAQKNQAVIVLIQ